MHYIHTEPLVSGSAVPISIIREPEGLFVVNTVTGEIVEQQLVTTQPSRHVIRHIRKYVGIDTRLPTTARDADELVEAASVHDPFLSQLSVNYQGLLELLGVTLKASEVRVLQFLCEHLTAWNYWFGSNHGLASALADISRTALYDALRVLEGGFIERCNRGLRGLLMIKVHPWYAFKGAEYCRKDSIERWCRMKAQQLGLPLMGALQSVDTHYEPLDKAA